MQEQEELEYGGFWIRTGASVVDSILVLLLTFPIMMSVYGWDYFSLETGGVVAGPVDFLVTWVLPAIAVIAFWIAKQATPGKMALSLHIVDAATGNTPPPASCSDDTLGISWPRSLSASESCG